MFLEYTPDGGETLRWLYKPAKMPSREAEAIERKTGWTLDEFTANLQKGSTLARRALLWTFQARTHPTLRFEDVEFVSGEVVVTMDAAEVAAIRRKILAQDFEDPDTRAAVLVALDEMAAAAPADPDADTADEAGAPKSRIEALRLKWWMNFGHTLHVPWYRIGDLPVEMFEAAVAHFEDEQKRIAEQNRRNARGG